MWVSKSSRGVSPSGMSPNSRGCCSGEMVQRPVIPESYAVVPQTGHAVVTPCDASNRGSGPRPLSRSTISAMAWRSPC